MNLTEAQTYLTAKAAELQCPLIVTVRQPPHMGAVSFVGELPDGTMIELGRSIQDAERAMRRIVGVEMVRPVHKDTPPVKTAKARKR